MAKKNDTLKPEAKSDKATKGSVNKSPAKKPSTGKNVNIDTAPAAKTAKGKPVVKKPVKVQAKHKAKVQPQKKQPVPQKTAAPAQTQPQQPASNPEPKQQDTPAQQPVAQAAQPAVSKPVLEEGDVFRNGILPEVPDEMPAISAPQEPASLVSAPQVNAAPPATDTSRVFVCQIEAEFLGGDIRIQINGTKIRRKDDMNYSIFGTEPTSGVILFDTTFDCTDLAEADQLWAELCDYEQNPGRYVKAKPGVPAPVAVPTAPPVDPNAHKQFENIPLTSMNIDTLINNMPSNMEELAKSQSNPIPASTGEAMDMAGLIAAQNIAAMEVYAESIVGHINGFWKVANWGYMPHSEALEFIANQFSKEYKYELLNSDKGFFIKMTNKDNLEVRVPKDPESYLKIQ